MPCRSQIAVQQRMEHPLTATSRTLIPRQRIDRALGHPPACGRVYDEIQARDNHADCDYKERTPIFPPPCLYLRSQSYNS